LRENRPAGWYRDPDGGVGQRYWDGVQLTDRYGVTTPLRLRPLALAGARIGTGALAIVVAAGLLGHETIVQKQTVELAAQATPTGGTSSPQVHQKAASALPATPGPSSTSAAGSNAPAMTSTSAPVAGGPASAAVRLVDDRATNQGRLPGQRPTSAKPSPTPGTSTVTTGGSGSTSGSETVTGSAGKGNGKTKGNAKTKAKGKTKVTASTRTSTATPTGKGKAKAQVTTTLAKPGKAAKAAKASKAAKPAKGKAAKTKPAKTKAKAKVKTKAKVKGNEVKDSGGLNQAKPSTLGSLTIQDWGR